MKPEPIETHQTNETLDAIRSELRYLRADIRKVRGVRSALGVGKRMYYRLNRSVTRRLEDLDISLWQKPPFLTLRYGALPVFTGPAEAVRLHLPHSDLVQQVRAFWFNNVPGTLMVDGHTITRHDIYTIGGPDPQFTCPICQRCEWLSRLYRANHFEPHTCPQAEACRTLCEQQGDELWAHHHQNFNFAVGCDPDLAAPKCLCILSHYYREPYSNTYRRFLDPMCDQLFLVLKRRLAYACQLDVVTYPGADIDWSHYDLVFTINTSTNRKFRRPDVPIMLFCHDMWLERFSGYQWVIDWMQPEAIMTSGPTQWREAFRIPGHTRVVFGAFASSQFFTRSNLDDKRLDLLVIGKTSNPVYAPRLTLSAQIAPLCDRYTIEFSHMAGSLRNKWSGPTQYEKPDGTMRFLNKWSEYLGSARYVVFGRIGTAEHQFVVAKHYEALGSGAIPIVPEVPDLALLGVKPYEHYIPLSEIEGNIERLVYLLDHYDEFEYIAYNAVAWYREWVDHMLFHDFECAVRVLTGERYPPRLVDNGVEQRTTQ